MMSKLQHSNILLFPRAMGIGGTENVVLQMCEALSTANKIVVCSCGGENVQRLKELGIKHYCIGDIADKSPKTVCKTWMALCKICREESITVIHVHDRMAALYAMLYCTLHRRVRFFATFHMNFRDKVLLTKLSYRRAKIIACGHTVAQTLIRDYKIPENCITVICNSIPETAVPAQDHMLESMRQHGDILIANVSRLTPQKDVCTFIKSFPVVKKHAGNVKYAIIGDGPQRVALEKLAADMGIAEDIVFLGNRRDARSLMVQVDLLVLSSAYEGFPLTPVEAFSQGKTMVATNVAGTNEIIENGENGLLVPAHNPGALADGILSVITNPVLKQTLERNAQETFADRFSFKRFKEDIAAFYEQNL